MYTATFPLSPLLYLHAHQCIPHLFHFLLCYNFMLINAYRNFSFFSFVITSCWSMDKDTFPLSPLLSLNADQCIPQLFPFLLLYLHAHQCKQKLFHFLLCYNHILVNGYRNFSTFSFVITSCWSMDTANFPLSPLLSNNSDLCIPQLFPFLLCFNLMLVNTYRNFSFFSFVINSCWSMHTATFPLSPLL